MKARYILVLLLALAAGHVWAEGMYISADGTIVRRADQAWLKVGGSYYLLYLAQPDLQQFVVAMVNKTVHVEGPMEVKEGTPMIRASTIIKGQGVGTPNPYSYGISGGGMATSYRATGLIPQPSSAIGPVTVQSYGNGGSAAVQSSRSQTPSISVPTSAPQVQY
jgi:hypothetical protein